RCLGYNWHSVLGGQYGRRGLAPRWRLVASWGWSRSQGLGCSPIKAVRELGLERRETVRSLYAACVGNLWRPVLSTRGPGRTNLWCGRCSAWSMAGWLRSGWSTDERIYTGSMLTLEMSSDAR